MNRYLARLALTVVLAATGAALAQLGYDPATIVSPLEELGVEASASGWYEGADAFQLRVLERGEIAHHLEGRGTLTEPNIALAASAIAAASGLGEGIRQPVVDFFRSRAPELAGQGRVAVALDAYVLTLDVRGEAPFDVDFSLAFQQRAEEAFPEPAHALGPADATYVVREFSDFQCPFCANYARETLPFVKDTLLARGDVRFEYHHFPLQSIHANAAPAAEAAECVAAANAPDAFWAYHDALFARQQAWAQLGEPNAYFVRLAEDLGLSTEGVQACLDDREHADEVAAAYEAAAGDLRLTGTPTVFVNGFRLQRFLEPDAYLELFDRIDAFAEEETVYRPAPDDGSDAP